MEDDPNVKKMWADKDNYMTFSSKIVTHDEDCGLISIIFGGMKNIFNNKRIINNIMMIGIQIFELELKESNDSKSKYHSSFEEIIMGKTKKECGYNKI